MVGDNERGRRELAQAKEIFESHDVVLCSYETVDEPHYHYFIVKGPVIAEKQKDFSAPDLRLGDIRCIDQEHAQAMALICLNNWFDN